MRRILWVKLKAKRSATVRFIHLRVIPTPKLVARMVWSLVPHAAPADPLSYDFSSTVLSMVIDGLVTTGLWGIW